MWILTIVYSAFVPLTPTAFVLKSSSSKASNSAVSQYECYSLSGIAIQLGKEHLQNISQKYM